MPERTSNLVLSATILVGLAVAAPVPAPADDQGAATLEGDLEQSDFSLDLRHRFEQVDDGSFGNEGAASTLRTVLDHASTPWNGVGVFGDTLELCFHLLQVDVETGGIGTGSADGLMPGSHNEAMLWTSWKL